MSIFTDADKPRSLPQPSELKAKPRKATKGAKPEKQAKATKQAKPTGGAQQQEGRGHSDEVIAMMKRARAPPRPEIMETSGWEKHTAQGFVSILGSKGGEKIESSKNAAGERVHKITK